MPETNPPPPVAATRPSKPVSEALLNEKVFSLFSFSPLSFLNSPSPLSNSSMLPASARPTDLQSIRKGVLLTPANQWDKCLSSLLIRSSLGLSFGVVFSVLLFKRRAWPAFVGLGFGAGRAYEECNGGFLRGAGKEGVRVQRP